MLLDNIGVDDSIQVSITCKIYNHEPYIRKTLDSFVNQQTTFKYEILLHDDASTDGTREIIKEYFYKYPDKIRAVLQDQNQYSQGKIISHEFLHPLVNGKYIALCEGDDYWPDYNKLQKQYDFLEQHKDYSAVGGVTKYFDDNDREVFEPLPREEFSGKDADEQCYLNNPAANIGSNTLMYYTQYIKEQCYLDAFKESPKVGDILLILHLFDRGKIYIMNDIFQNHRIQTRPNASNYNNIFDNNTRIAHSMAVINSVENNFGSQHNLDRWIYRQLTPYLVQCIRRRNIKSFIQCYSMMPKRYKKYSAFKICRELFKALQKK